MENTLPGPDEIKVFILGYLEAADLLVLTRVCRDLRRLVCDRTFQPRIAGYLATAPLPLVTVRFYCRLSGLSCRDLIKHREGMCQTYLKVLSISNRKIKRDQFVSIKQALFNVTDSQILCHTCNCLLIKDQLTTVLAGYLHNFSDHQFRDSVLDIYHQGFYDHEATQLTCFRYYLDHGTFTELEIKKMFEACGNRTPPILVKTLIDFFKPGPKITRILRKDLMLRWQIDDYPQLSHSAYYVQNFDLWLDAK